MPAWSGKNSRCSSSVSKGGALYMKGERNSRVVPPFPESLRCLSFPCTVSTFKPRIDSHHGGTWDSPVGKPRGKASWESRRSLDSREGKRDSAATAREESARACPLSRRGLNPLVRLQKYPHSMSAVERNPQVPASTSHKVSGPGFEGEESREAPEQVAWGLAFPEATRAGP